MSDLVKDAVARIAAGEVPERVSISTGGRPKEQYQIGPLTLSKAEYALVEAEVGKVRRRTVFSQEDLVELARSGVPGLLERAHSLAMESDDIRAILLVAKELMDRSFGKAVQGVQVSMGDDITAAWRQLGVIDAEEASSEGQEAAHDPKAD